MNDESIVWLILHGASSLTTTQLRHRDEVSHRLETQLTLFIFLVQSGTNADNILRNSQEVSTNVNGQREGRRPTGNQSEICAKTKSQLLYLLFCDLRVQARP